MMRRNKYLVFLFVLLLVGGAFVYFSTQTAQAPEQREISEQETQPESVEAISCSGEATPSLTEGPYYKENSPERNNIAEGQEGDRLVVEGYVLNTDCEPISGAWIDFWQAGASGNYDLAGYDLRGHQHTDVNGRFRLETVMPARYSGRTAHIHVKVRANNDAPVLTTQLFFPDDPQNRVDSIFNEELVVNLEESDTSYIATYNFILQ